MSTDTAERILDTTRRLIAERGYNAFSYADIAAVVKISKPSIHFHFATKGALVQKLLVLYRAALRDKLAEATTLLPDPLARLRAYTGYWESCIRDNSAPFCVCALLAAELPSLPEEVATEVKGYFRDLAAWLTATLEDGARQGKLALRRGAVAEAESLMAGVHGAMLSARVSGGDADLFAAIVGDAVERLSVAVV
jgi:TetR/AcrR family transcriptional repressor of nem operon